MFTFYINNGCYVGTGVWLNLMCLYLFILCLCNTECTFDVNNMSGCNRCKVYISAVHAEFTERRVLCEADLYCGGLHTHTVCVYLYVCVQCHHSTASKDTATRATCGLSPLIPASPEHNAVYSGVNGCAARYQID